MELWAAALLMIFCLSGGIGLLLAWNKNKKRIFLIMGITIFAGLVICILYCAAALLLLGGID